MSELITQAEIDVLRRAMNDGDRQSPAGVTLYDFRNPVALSAGEVQALRRRFKSLAVMLSRLVSAYLGHPTQLALHSLDTCTQGQYARALAGPTALGVVLFEPGPTRVYWELSPGLTDVALDCMLGGTGQGGTAGAVGPVSRAVLACLFREILSTWVEVWPALRESRPRLAQVQDTPPEPGDGAEERIIEAVLTGHCGDREGLLRLCLPLRVIRPLLRVAPSPEPAPGQLQVDMSETRVTVAAYLEAPAMPVARLMKLRPGDVLDLRLPADNPCTVSVGGKPKFAGAAGTSHAKRAVELQRPLS